MNSTGMLFVGNILKITAVHFPNYLQCINFIYYSAKLSNFLFHYFALFSLSERGMVYTRVYKTLINKMLYHGSSNIQEYCTIISNMRIKIYWLGI